jgi:hypothetical protein
MDAEVPVHAYRLEQLGYLLTCYDTTAPEEGVPGVVIFAEAGRQADSSVGSRMCRVRQCRLRSWSH